MNCAKNILYSGKILLIILLLSQTGLTQIVETETFQNKQAIEELKQNGSYDSLVKAYKDSRQKDELSSASDFSVGQDVKLFDESGSANKYLGYSVAISGNTMAVGVPGDTITQTRQGSVRIYVRTGLVWNLQATLTASDAVQDAFFGNSVDIEGDTVVIGAENDLWEFFNIGDRPGSAYVFTRSGNVWTQQTKFNDQTIENGSQFGSVVKISNQTITISAPLDDSPFSDRGAVFIYNKDLNGNWVFDTFRSGFASENGSQCGRSMDLEGDLLLMGCEFDDNGSVPNEGIVYTYRRDINGFWQAQSIVSPLSGSSEYFGRAVSISGNSIVITNGASTGLNFRAYIYNFNGTAWNLEQTIANQAFSFGWKAQIDGDVLAVSAIEEDISANSNQGSVYIYKKISGVWTQQPRLLAYDGNANELFGYSLDFVDGYLAIGSIGANATKGAVYVNRILNTNWLTESEFTSSDGSGTDNFGDSVAISGDTAVIGAPNDDFASGFDQGSVYVFVRNGSTWTQQARIQASDPGSIDNFGSSVAIYGDLVVVGAVEDDVNGNVNRGSAYIFSRSGTTWTEESKLIATDGNADDFFGNSVAIQNTTAVIGARGADGGAVYVFNKSGGVWTQTNKLVSSDLAANDNFGVSVAISSFRIIVGASLDDHSGFTNIGSAYIFAGVSSSWTEEAKIIPSDPEGDIRFGVRVDLTDDTAIIGATQDTVDGIFQKGSAYIFTRSGTIWTQQAKLTASDGALQDLFGNSVALEGNIAVVGVLRKDISGNANQGAVYVFERTNGVWTQTNKLFDSNGLAGDSFGTSVGISGTKILIGTPFANIPAFSPLAGADQGSASIYINTPIAPTVANVSIAGRVSDNSKQGISKAQMTLLNTGNGEILRTTTNQFGNFRFENLPFGEIYILSVNHGRYVFEQNQQLIQPYEELDDVIFVGENR